MTSIFHPVLCQLQAQKQPPLIPSRPITKPTESSIPSSDQVKIVLQPRLTTLRSFGSDRGVGVLRTRRDGGGVGDGGSRLSPFLANLYDYVESTKKSQDFETISGRLAMVVFVATVSEELVTGNSVFGKMDLQGIAEAAGICFAAVACAAIFASVSAARNRVGTIFTVGCNSFIDSLIDNIVDGLFYDSELTDWMDEK